MKPLITALIVLTLASSGTLVMAKQFRPENHNAEMNLDEAVLQSNNRPVVESCQLKQKTKMAE